MKDYLVRGLVNSKNCRVFACRTTNLVDVARKNDVSDFNDGTNE